MSNCGRAVATEDWSPLDDHGPANPRLAVRQQRHVAVQRHSDTTGTTRRVSFEKECNHRRFGMKRPPPTESAKSKFAALSARSHQMKLRRLANRVAISISRLWMQSRGWRFVDPYRPPSPHDAVSSDAIYYQIVCWRNDGSCAGAAAATSSIAADQKHFFAHHYPHPRIGHTSYSRNDWTRKPNGKRRLAATHAKIRCIATSHVPEI